MTKFPELRLPLLKTDGSFADPVEFVKNEVAWKFTLIPVLSDNDRLPSIDLKIEVIDFGRHRACFLTGLVIDTEHYTRFDATFHANKSTFMFRNFSRSISKNENGTFDFEIFGMSRSLEDRFDQLGVVMEKADDGTVTLRASDELNDHPTFARRIASTYLLGIETHVCMTMQELPVGVLDVSWWNPTFRTKHLGQKLEINLEWFESIRPNMKELLDGIPKMSKAEFVDLQSVLGLYYHDYATGKFVDGRILRIMQLAEQMGFKKLDCMGLLCKLGKVTVVEDDDEASEPSNQCSGKNTFVEMCKISSNTPFLFKQSFDDVLLNLSIYPSKFNDQPYLSLIVVLFPPTDALYHVTVKISSALFQGEVSRYISASQNTMGIPTLYRSSEELELELKIEVEYRRVRRLAKDAKLPGLNDIVLKFGEKRIEVNKDYLMEHIAYFRSFASFEKEVADEIELKTFEYLDVLLVLQVLYHRTSVLTEFEFKQCVITADALACDEVLRICETSENTKE